MTKITYVILNIQIKRGQYTHMKNNYKFWNIVIIIKDDCILMIDRNKGDFGGYVPPGGKVEFPETFSDSAIREVKEETGLDVLSLDLYGISGYINEIKHEQYIYLDFLCTKFEGELLEVGPEGNLEWIPIESIEKIEITPHIKKRILNILKKKRYEYQVFWDENAHAAKGDYLFPWQSDII